MNSIFQPFETLPPFDQSVDYISLLREVSNNATTKTDTNTQLKTIFDLRRMRKYQEKFFEATFSNILGRFISCYVDENKDNESVIEAFLFFIGEIFSDYQFDFNESWIYKLYNVIEKYFFSSNQKLSELAKNAAKNLAIHMNYTPTLICLFDTLADCDEQTAKFIEELFSIVFQNVTPTNLVNLFDWNEVLCEIHINQDRNSPEFKRMSMIFQKIKEYIGDSWQELINNLANDEEKILLENLSS